MIVWFAHSSTKTTTSLCESLMTRISTVDSQAFPAKTPAIKAKTPSINLRRNSNAERKRMIDSNLLYSVKKFSS